MLTAVAFGHTMGRPWVIAKIPVLVVVFHTPMVIRNQLAVIGGGPGGYTAAFLAAEILHGTATHIFRPRRK